MNNQPERRADPSGPLTLSDIADSRAYERERDAFRRHVIAVKKLRRVSVGPIVTLTFENRLTMRFQIQEMARAEKMTTDDAIQHELDVYNRLLPGPGELSATLFLELTTAEELRTWLPALVGVERSCELHIGPSATAIVVASVPEADHDARLTRPEVTSAVHYVRFPMSASAAAAFEAGPVRLKVNHPSYPPGHEGAELSDESRSELAGDLI
jgi:hypothetical protein